MAAPRRRHARAESAQAPARAPPCALPPPRQRPRRRRSRRRSRGGRLLLYRQQTKTRTEATNKIRARASPREVSQTRCPTERRCRSLCPTPTQRGRETHTIPPSDLPPAVSLRLIFNFKLNFKLELSTLLSTFRLLCLPQRLGLGANPTLRNEKKCWRFAFSSRAVFLRVTSARGFCAFCRACRHPHR